MTPAAVHALTDATWPAFAHHPCGPVTLREGRGGGARVSSASLRANDLAPDDLLRAEQAMQALGQVPLFRVDPVQTALDDRLAARGYRARDALLVLAADTGPLARAHRPGGGDGLAHWPPVALVRQLWADAGLPPARQAIMARATVPKAVILGHGGAQAAGRAAGTAYVALGEDAAMLHALDVRPAYRRQGIAHNMMCAAARWAQENGAARLCLLVLADNDAARALYASMGFETVGNYHYREKMP